jgi:hypothetical protein
MRYTTKLAATAAATAIMIVAIAPSALADREQRASESYSGAAHTHSEYRGRSEYRDRAENRRAEARRVHAERKWRRAYDRKRARHYAYPWGPWGPFAGPPGL